MLRVGGHGLRIIYRCQKGPNYACLSGSLSPHGVCEMEAEPRLQFRRSVFHVFD